MNYTFIRSMGGQFIPDDDTINLSMILPEKYWTNFDDMQTFLISQITHEHMHSAIYKVGESLETTARLDFIDGKVREYLFRGIRKMIDKYGLEFKSNKQLRKYYKKMKVFK